MSIIESLAGLVEASFGEDCTHLIWSHGLSKRHMTAKIMDIFVVSPLWIEQCKQAKKRVSETDFLASSVSTFTDAAKPSTGSSLSSSGSKTQHILVPKVPVPLTSKGLSMKLR